MNVKMNIIILAFVVFFPSVFLSGVNSVESKEENPKEFISLDKYLKDLCTYHGLKFDLVKGILLTENPQLIPTNQHYNYTREDGRKSIDRGLFQINNIYQTSFEESKSFTTLYLKFENKKLNIFDPFYNTALAVSILKDIRDHRYVTSDDEMVLIYNAGLSYAKNNNFRKAHYNYLSKFKKNMTKKVDLNSIKALIS
jgi:hypothetical protein